MHRVGEGPFPTELHDEDGANLRQIGKDVFLYYLLFIWLV